MDYKVEKIPQYKSGDKIVLIKFKPEWGFPDLPDHPRVGVAYTVQKYVESHPWKDMIRGEIVATPAVMLALDDSSDEYGGFEYWWIPTEIIEHAKSMDELTKFIKDKVKAVKGA
jgi:hypothetical protein